MRWLGLASRYTSWQAFALGLQVVAAFVVVRLLSVEEYAALSIVLAVMTAAVTVADGGICNTLNARAAPAGTPEARGSWLAAARHLALSRVPWVVVVAAAATWLLLRGDHATTAFALFGAALVATYLSVTLARMLWHVMARLCCPPAKVLAVDTLADSAKPALTMLLVLAWPVAAAVLLLPVVISVLHGLVYRKLAASCVARTPYAPAQLADLQATTRQVLPVTIFFAVQGQIALWVVSALGSTSDVAGLGALGRFSLIFSLAGPFLANVLSPRLAAITDPGHLRMRVRQTLMAAVTLALAVPLASAVLAQPALRLLGPSYAGLELEFVAVMAIAGLHFIAGVINTVNVSRAWYSGYWLVIPATLAGQGAVTVLLDVSTLIGALALSGLSGAALLAVYGAICVRGVAQSSILFRAP